MKRKLSLLILAMIPAVFPPLAAISQVEPDKAPATSNEPTNKYQVFAGWGYTSLNQVNQSRSGLQGVSLSVTRDWGKYFGVTAEGGHYAWSLTTSNASVGKPTVDMYLAGPALHAQLYGPFSIMVHGLLGAVHTGGVSISPSESFAGGVGLGVQYDRSAHLGLRLYGDDIGSSFTVTPFQPGDSPHRRFNARASIGVVYKF